MGPAPARYQSTVRRPYEQHARLHFQHIPTLQRPANDGCTECSLDPPHRLLPSCFTIPSYRALSLTQRTQVRTLIHSRSSCCWKRHPPLLSVWRNWADIYLLHAQQVFKPFTGDSHSDTKDADDDVERALVWPSAEWDAVGGRGIGVWGCGG